MKVQSESVVTHYDELDPFYRSLWGEHLHHGLWLTGHESVEEAVKNLIQHVIERAFISHDSRSRVCDIGCGYGGTSQEEMIYLLTQAGFKEIKFENLSSQVSQTWSICIKRALKSLVIDPTMRSFLRNQSAQNRVFFKSVFRIRLAYALGIMQYGIFSATKFSDTP